MHTESAEEQDLLRHCSPAQTDLGSFLQGTSSLHRLMSCLQHEEQTHAVAMCQNTLDVMIMHPHDYRLMHELPWQPIAIYNDQDFRSSQWLHPLGLGRTCIRSMNTDSI